MTADERQAATYDAAAVRAKLMRKAVAGAWFCSRCEFTHEYCECDEWAHLGTHSRHLPGHRPHPMGE